MSKRLGKGIEALISSHNTEMSDKYLNGSLPLKDIIPNKNQPRKEFNIKSMEELINSISENGILQPITVRPISDDKYEIIAGERRFRAAKSLALESIPAYILDINSDVEVMELAIIENIQRENLNPIEEAEGYTILSQEHGLSQKDIAKKIGKSRSEIANTLRLMKLPVMIKKSLTTSINQGGISKGHARALLSLSTKKEMINVFNRIVDKNLSVRETEIIVKKYSKKPLSKKVITPKKVKDNLLIDVENQLISSLGTKVKVTSHGNQSGNIKIEFYTQDDFERIIQVILKS